MSTDIPTGNGGVSGSEHQQLRTKSKGSRSRESQIDDADDYYGIETMRKKLILDLGIEVKIMRNEVFGKNEKAKEKQLLASSIAVAADGYPWKLRSKTNAIKEIAKKLCIELSKSEIEEDFIKMVGHPPPRKPNKRPNIVQNRLDVSCVCFSLIIPMFFFALNGRNFNCIEILGSDLKFFDIYVIYKQP
jgi:hypothetical protein